MTKFRSRKLIIITHHLASIVNFDRIYMLKSGQLIGSGIHGEQLASCPSDVQLQNIVGFERQVPKLEAVS